MPGIVLSYSKKSKDRDLRKITSGISDKIFHCNEYSSQDVGLDHKVFARVACHNKDFSGISTSDQGFLIWFGRPFYKGKALDAEILSSLKDVINKKDIKALAEDISGAFQLAIYFRDSGTCYFVCDKTSSHPAYYTETDDFVVFSPEPLSFKALKQFGWRSSIRRGSLFEYIASGYLWGDECFEEGIKRVGPGQIISLNQEGIHVQKYWKMTFAKEQAMEQFLITELFEAVEKDINDLPPGNRILTLSGGYDSRALLALLKESNEKINTISYSFGSSQSKGMDIDVGEYYANKAGVAHSYYRASLDDTSRLMNDIQSSVVATGGENYLSIFQDAFLGEGFYRDLAGKYDYMIRGDEVWGWGDLAVNRQMAFWESRLFNLNEILHPKIILTSDAYEEGIKYINRKREEFVSDCDESMISPNDLKDYLYWRHREARLLQSMAYFRRCYLPHFAPLLFDNTLAVIKKTHSKFRVQKNLFISMCKQKFPKLFLDGRATSPKVSDVNNFQFLYKEKRFRAFVKGALLESRSDIFNNIFDRGAFEKWVDKVLDEESADIDKIRRSYDLKRLIAGVLEKSAYLKGSMKAFMVKKGMNIFPVLNVNYLFRLVVLSLALQEYENN